MHVHHLTSSPRKALRGNIDPDHIAPQAGVDYDNVESKFQLSFKTKVLQSFFLGHGDLWGYIQISHWQIYNNDLRGL
jgi:phospholipase A1